VKGIILAGGTGTRLWPITHVTSKQLLPIFDKPLIYYPLSTLMHAQIREILLITTSLDQSSFQSLLGDGSDFGLEISYEIQESPNGLAEAFIIAEDFLKGESAALILGDNVFHGAGLGSQLIQFKEITGAHIFVYPVSDPSSYGVLDLDVDNRPKAVSEKPLNPKSNLAITGLYFVDGEAVEIAKNVKPSPRGELEITSIIDFYLSADRLSFSRLSRGVAWLDTGTPSAMFDASSYVKIIEERTGTKIGCIEEIAFINSWISSDDLSRRIQKI
jgi:glucose-1-phosphate thymidylyltransferase